MHEEKHKAEIINKLEFLCPNAKDLRFEDPKEEHNFMRVQEAIGHYKSMHRVLIEDDFKKYGWTTIPEQEDDLVYLAALNSVIESSKHLR